MCLLVTTYEQNLVKTFRPYYEAKTESFFFKEMTPISAETFDELHTYRASNVETLKMSSREMTRHGGKGHAWTFATLLTNLGVMYANLWWIRLVDQKEPILVLGEHDHELTDAVRRQHFQRFYPDYDKYGSSPGSCGFQ